MDWHFHITATCAPRLLMRVAMIFDQQSLTLTALDWRCDQQAMATDVRLCVACEESLARRIHAKLLHLQDILAVELLADAASPSREDSPTAAFLDGDVKAAGS